MYSKKDKTEYWSTPQNIVDKLWSFFPDQYKNKNCIVFDSCAGDGALCNPSILPSQIHFIKWDINPRANDVEKHDFFKEHLPYCDIAVLNPPFGLKKEWIERLFTVAKYILLIAPKSAFRANWDCVVASGKEPDFTIENMTSFKGITTPIMVGLLKKVDTPMENKEKNQLYKEYINNLINKNCHLDYWRRMFQLSKEHPDYTWEQLNEIHQ